MSSNYSATRKYIGPLPTYCAAVRLRLRNPNLHHNANSDFGPFWNWHTDYFCLGAHLDQFRVIYAFLFPVTSAYVTDGQTGRRTDGRARHVLWPIRTAAQ